MRFKTVFVALMLVLAAGPALAVGGVGAQQASVANDHDCEYQITVEDNTGEEITIEEEPEEVVVLAPNVAQHIWEIDAEEKVTGMPVNQFTAYLEGSEQRTNVVDELGQPINEEVVALEADLVLAPNIISEEAVDELRDSGETVYHYPVATDLESMMELVELTGQLVGACEAATEKTDELADRIGVVEQAVEGEDAPTVFYDLGDEPSGPFTVNSQALEHDVVTTAGAENIAADIESPTGYPEVSTEFVIGEDPEWVISPGGTLSEFPGYDETAALSNDRVIEVDANLISQHGPRNVDVLEDIAEELHPEAMEEVRQATDDGDADDATDDADDANGDAADEETADDDAADDADDDGPGLTVGAAVAALVGLALVAMRRE